MTEEAGALHRFLSGTTKCCQKTGKIRRNQSRGKNRNPNEGAEEEKQNKQTKRITTEPETGQINKDEEKDKTIFRNKDGTIRGDGTEEHQTSIYHGTDLQNKTGRKMNENLKG